jgi:pimeloyl-ACP methyl ester carboxylesterase
MTGEWDDNNSVSVFVDAKSNQAPLAFRCFLSALLLLCCFAAGCATPIGVVRGTTQQTYHALTANVLSAGEPSSWSKQLLHRNNLSEQFEDNPVAALAELHKRLKERITSDRLFALAELCFFHAEQSGKREYYLAAAVYAYAFILPDREDLMIRPIDPRARLAVDLYNWGISRGLTSNDGEDVLLEAGTWTLPFGEMTLTNEPSQFFWGGYRFKRFIPVGEFITRGLANRYRQAGVGAALAAELEPVETGPAAEAARKRIPPRTKVPVTAFVRFTEPLDGVLQGKIQGRIELYAADQTTTVRVRERDVPLELEPTAALALGLEGSPVWDFEIAGFRFADPRRIFGDGLVMMQPYRRGRIPVVLVHGTASSPARWADMYNELTHDPIIEGRYQVWLFQYNTGQPILYSAMLLRRALASVVKELDPDGEDSSLQQMVIMGHSQGGLLTKLMAIKSGNRFWQNVSDKPFEQVEMAPEVRQLLSEAMFFEPVPMLRRVVFIATPHRGSYHATGWLLSIARRLITLPGNLVSQFAGLLQGQAFAHLGSSQIPTSVDNMSPGHPFLRALNDLPIDPRITAHSIIAVLGDAPFLGKNDGVVAYESAHIDGVESEKVVHSSHSTQSNPDTIEEVRRILREHIGVK